MSTRYVDLARQALAERRRANGGRRVLGGRTVAEVVRESANVVWFRDETAAAWMYVHRRRLPGRGIRTRMQVPIAT